ncbi:MAG: hypothetical protein GY849_02535 [Deltaproteobacteria bacterium]|nr:hypothetical protein [Deltaproteobacteria bacterium]
MKEKFIKAVTKQFNSDYVSMYIDDIREIYEIDEPENDDVFNFLLDFFLEAKSNDLKEFLQESKTDGKSNLGLQFFCDNCRETVHAKESRCCKCNYDLATPKELTF